VTPIRTTTDLTLDREKVTMEDIEFYNTFGIENKFALGWADEKNLKGARDLFMAQNWMSDSKTNGTSKETFATRHTIDLKNMEESFIGKHGLKWDKYGECGKCGKESELRCVNCPWKFYCSKEHQTEDWANHKKMCKSIVWDESGKAIAGKNIKPGTPLFEQSCLLVTPRFHRRVELDQMNDEDHAKIIAGPMRPCFGCHLLIQPYLNTALVCSKCQFPTHSTACSISPWHKDECQVLQNLGVKVEKWYDQVGGRKDIMIILGVLRAIILKKSHPKIWEDIMALSPDANGLAPKISDTLKKSTVQFIREECKVDWIEKHEILKVLSIYLKHRLNCCLKFCDMKRMVSVICKGGLPFTLVNDSEANVDAGVFNFRMRISFRAIRPLVKGDEFKIGLGGSV